MILSLAWMWAIVYAFPGVMVQDSIDHLTEARDGFYTDGHPPFMNAMWRFTELFVAGPFGLLVIQTTLFVAGVYALMRVSLAPRPAAWTAAALVIFPPIAVSMGVIWKDAIMAGCLTLGAVGLQVGTRRATLGALAALWLATAVRYNAAAATAPLIVLLFVYGPAARGLRRYAAAVGVWVALTASTLFVNGALTDREMHYWYPIAVHDIAGALVRAEPPPSNAEIEEMLVGTQLVEHENLLEAFHAAYSPRNFAGLISRPEKRLWILPQGGIIPPTQERLDALAAAWTRVIRRYPSAYAAHRLAVIADVLSKDPKGHNVVMRREYVFPSIIQGLGLPVGGSRWQHALDDAWLWLAANTPLFTPWLYLVLALALVPFALRHRDILALLLSGLGLESSLLVLAPSRDYRYSHWMITTTVFAVVLLTVRRMRYKAA